MTNTHLAKWKEYCTKELATLSPILTSLGIKLDAHQPHIGGERYLMQAVTTTSGKKLILLGTETASGKMVVVKATNDPNGKKELLHDRNCRKLLNRIGFAYNTFLIPAEIAFVRKSGYIISVQEFIAQPKSFLEHTLEEQFTLALSAFKTQEGARATTYAHKKQIVSHFGKMEAEQYLQKFNEFTLGIRASQMNSDLSAVLEKAQMFLTAHRTIIQQYSGFLTHTDFVPHNIRIVDSSIYLLDHSSLRFGNKYEGWARFLNFMELYNPPLTQLLTNYVRDNRTPEELLSLQLMRVYRLGEIIWFYVQTLEKTSGDLQKLNTARVSFWTEILKATLGNHPVEESIITEYKKTRDSLRSDEEKKRQIGLH